MPQAISRRIVITAYDGISLLDLAGPLEAFRVASTFGGPSPSGRLATYEYSVVSVRREDCQRRGAGHGFSAHLEQDAD